MEMSGKIQQRINQAIKTLSVNLDKASNTRLIKLAIEVNALPITGLQGGPVFLRANGEMFEYSNGEKPVSPGRETLALVAGSDRYPWLRELLPQRDKSDIDCPVCKGKGKISYAEVKGMYCLECNGLGWKRTV